MGVVSQEQRAADEAREKFALDFEMVSDPRCEIAQALFDRDILEIFLDGEFPKHMAEIMGVSDASECPGGAYQFAMQQPAVVALGQDFTPFFLWASIPGAANMGGALGRPRAQDALDACLRGINGDLSAVRWEPRKALPVPFRGLFYLLILANGNFLKFRGLGGVFKDGVEVQTPMDRIRLSLVKLVAAIGAWGAYAYLQRTRPSFILTPMVGYCVYMYHRHGVVFKALMKPQGSSMEDGLLRKKRKL